MNIARRIVHSVLFAAGLGLIVCTMIFLLQKNLWYFDTIALVISFALGFFSGTFDKKADEPLKLAVEDPESEEIDDDLDNE